MNNKHLWDFDENKNYKTHEVNNIKYKVLDLKNSFEAAKLLNKLDNLLMRLFISLELSNERDKYINLLLQTPHELQEMQLIKDQAIIKFEGLNKPKNIKNYRSLDSIGTDKTFRAKNRVIFLTLRDENGKLKNVNSIISLLAHELTHTALNHLSFIDDNHSHPFNKYYNIIHKILKRLD